MSPIPMDEFNNFEEHKGRAFGAVSKERQVIIKWLYENGAGTPEEISNALGMDGLDTKLCKTRLDVMRRDKLVDWRDKDDEVFYGLTDKGVKRAEGKTPEPTEKPKKKK